jgi:hypothetical protein
MELSGQLHYQNVYPFDRSPRYPLEVKRAPEPVWTRWRREKSAIIVSVGNWTVQPLAESLYWLSYPAVATNKDGERKQIKLDSFAPSGFRCISNTDYTVIRLTWLPSDNAPKKMKREMICDLIFVIIGSENWRNVGKVDSSVWGYLYESEESLRMRWRIQSKADKYWWSAFWSAIDCNMCWP